MSVIIRLQNLPWSANALDVRNFFKGLSIPDGGVHIVGGEMGDAFIAFSTDEDARQAMMMNGGKIKEVQVSLLLSSRAQMQKVIEDARRTTMSFMQLSAQSAQQMQPQVPVVPKVTAPAVTVAHQPQPPVISLSGFLAQNLNQQKAQSLYSEIPGLGFLATGGGMFQPNAPAAGLFSALSAQTYDNAGTASNAAFKQLSEQLKKVGEAEKTMGSTTKVPMSSSSTTTSTTKKESGERSSRRSRSSSRERDRRRSRSRSRDRGSRRRGRDRSRDRRSRSRSRDRRDRRRRSRSRDRRDDRPREKSREREQKAAADKLSKQRVSRFSDRPEPKPAAAAAAAEVVVVPTPTSTPIPPQPSIFVSPWDTPIQQSLMKLANVGLDKPVQQNASLPTKSSSPNSATGDGRTDQPQNNALPNPIAASYRMNVLPSVNYGSFQSSKPLSNEQLSKLQQLQVQRDPMVCQDSNPAGNRQGGHFSDGESKAYATTKQGRFDSMSRRDAGGNRPSDGYQTDSGTNKRKNQSMEEKVDRSMYDDDLDGQSVKMSYLETITGYGEVRRFFHGQTISSNGIKMINDPAGRRTGVALVRFLRKDGKRYALSRDGMRLKNSVVKIEPISDQEFEDAVDSYRPGYEDGQSNWREVSLDRKDSKKEEVIEIRDDGYSQGSRSGTVVIWNLPTMTTELDLMKIFSDFSVVEVLIIKNYKNPKQLDGYVKFHRWEDARRACDTIHKHYVRNKRVFVKQCTEIEYDAAKNEYEAPQVISEQEPEPVTVVLDDSTQEMVESSKASTKKHEAVDDDKMDLAAEEDDVGQQKIHMDGPPLLNQMKLNAPPPSLFQLGMRGELSNDSQQRQMNDGLPPFNRESPSNYQLGGDSWEREQPQQTPPMNRDPRNMFNQNFGQQQQQQQKQQQQQQQQQLPASQLNLGFGGDMSRDPRRRQDTMGQKLPGFDQSSFQSDNSRDSFGSQSRFSSQGPPPSMDNNRYGQQMGPMGGGGNRYDQQQSGSFGNSRYDQQMGNNLGGPVGNNRYDQQMGNNLGGPVGNNRYDQQMGNSLGGPLGNNRYQQQQQQQQQLSNNPGSQFDGNRFDQQMNRNNAGGNDGGNDKTTFIMITNLEYNMQESRIQDFFDHAGFNPKHIHIIRNPYGRSTGECLVEFGSPQEAGDTLSKNACILGKRKAFIKHLNRSQILEMMQRINQNGPGQNSQRGGQFGGNSSFGGNGSFGGNNNFDGNSSNWDRGNNFGNNDNGNRNVFGGNNYRDNDDNRRSQGNDNRFSNENRNSDGDNFQGSNYQDDSDNQHLDDEKREDDVPHDDYDEHDDHKDHDDDGDHDDHGDHGEHDDHDIHDDHDEHDDHDDHDDHDGHDDQQNISEKNKVPDPESNTKQLIEDLTGNDDLMDEAAAKEPTNNTPFQKGPEDDDPPVKQPTMDDTDSCEIIEIPDQPAEGHEQQQPKDQQQQQQLHQQEDAHVPEDEDPEPNDGEPDQQPEPMRGNIVCLSNLPFRARNEELVKHFREYNITLEDVKRRYLPDGRPTGDAMVRFQSAVNAQRAMQTHHNRRIGGRPIRMKILDD